MPSLLRIVSLLTLLTSFAAPSPDDDLGSLSEPELLEIVRDKKESTDKAVFEELGKRKTRTSLQALSAATQELSGVWPLRSAYGAFVHFRGVEDLEGRAIAFLAGEAKSRNARVSSSSTQALAKFGEPAHSHLAKILKSSKDPETRATALGPLMPSMAAGGQRADFQTICDNLYLCYAIRRKFAVDTFKAFALSGGAELFARKLSDRKLSIEVRGLLISALAETPGDPFLEVLLEGLDAREPRVLFATLQALASRGTDRHIDALKRLSRHQDDYVRREALVSRARILGGDPSFFDQLIDLTEHKGAVERGAAAISLGELGTVEAMQALHALLDDKAYIVRAEALIAVAAARHPTSIPILIQRLDQVTGIEHERTTTELRLLTAEDYGTKTQRWAKWWADHGDDFAMPSIADATKADSARKERRANNQTQTAFYGLRVSSDRVAFVIDLSGSMNGKTKSDKSRLEVLKIQLDHFLKEYPSGQLFNLIFFGKTASKWKPELTLMNDKIRASARSHVRSLKAPGATAIYDGLMAAFEDPRVDTIYLLTDGSPSGGTIDDIDEIIAEVRRWNSLRHLIIHSISVGKDSRLLRTLSADSHGHYIRAD